VRRYCDGKDDLLVRFDPLAVDWKTCGCGLTFDDAERKVTWPHEVLEPRMEHINELARGYAMVYGITTEDALTHLRSLDIARVQIRGHPGLPSSS
jgi:hypothetical protein